MSKLPHASYWVLAVTLLVFGALAMFSIGAPFFALGATLMLLAPFRERPTVFWSWLGGVLAFFPGYLLVAPLRCTARAVMATDGSAQSVTEALTVCTTMLGFHYSGQGTYNPPLWPALLLGLLVAALAGFGLRALLRRRPSTARQAP